MSEFRQDLVSGDWMISAPERAARPHDFLPKKRSRKPTPKSSCPFENLEGSGNWPPIFAVPEGKNWRLAIVPNKFPALTHSQVCADVLGRGPYRFSEGVGHHDLVITRSHTKNLADMSVAEGAEVFEALQKRFRMMVKDKCLVYTSAFFNWGVTSGASIYHPHYQMLTLPIIPSHIRHSLDGSAEYYKKERRCVHCDIIAYEKKTGDRIVEKNAGAVAFAPFVSKQPLTVRIYPTHHQPYFERTPARDIRSVVEILGSTMRRMRKYLNDPDFNFFIHTSPIKNQDRYRHYHWHIEIRPKVAIPAGFELSTGVDINPIDPDRAAAMLRGELD